VRSDPGVPVLLAPPFESRLAHFAEFLKRWAPTDTAKTRFNIQQRGRQSPQLLILCRMSVRSAIRAHTGQRIAAIWGSQEPSRSQQHVSGVQVARATVEQHLGKVADHLEPVIGSGESGVIRPRRLRWTCADAARFAGSSMNELAV